MQWNETKVTRYMRETYTRKDGKSATRLRKTTVSAWEMLDGTRLAATVDPTCDGEGRWDVDVNGYSGRDRGGFHAVFTDEADAKAWAEATWKQQIVQPFDESVAEDA